MTTIQTDQAQRASCAALRKFAEGGHLGLAWSEPRAAWIVSGPHGEVPVAFAATGRIANWPQIIGVITDPDTWVYL